MKINNFNNLINHNNTIISVNFSLCALELNYRMQF